MFDRLRTMISGRETHTAQETEDIDWEAAIAQADARAEEIRARPRFREPAECGQTATFLTCDDECIDCQDEAQDYYTRQAGLSGTDELTQYYTDKAERAAGLKRAAEELEAAGDETYLRGKAARQAELAAAVRDQHSRSDTDSNTGDGAENTADNTADNAAGSESESANSGGDTRSDEESEQFQRDYHQAARDYNTAALEMHNAEMRQLHLDEYFHVPDEYFESQAEIYCAVPDGDGDTDTAAG